MIGYEIVDILRKIKGHEDLVKLNDVERLRLCAQLRQFLVEHVAQTGGHLASNLGVVELTVAIETVFDTAKDRLVFDVGHQSYVHKLLTGRQADFARLRQLGGIAGFPKPGESVTDSFVAGHASSAVSIALGMARARTLQNQDHKVIALVGDGAATGGMVYEGLNDAGDSREPMIVILNDNEMSIDRNVGGMARHLSKLRSGAKYLGAKARYRRLLSRLPGGRAIYTVTSRMKNWMKRALIPGTVFEHMGFNYFGPVDGHDLNELISLLTACKDMKEPVLIHVMTHKGHGYSFAEENPAKFHGVGKFDPETGKTNPSAIVSFSDTFGKTMVDLAGENDRLCAITAAMPGGTGLLDFKNTYPKRLFDVGIAEEHAISMAGGLAKQGMIPVVALYSTFLQRSYDQILQDIAMLRLHVVLAVDRAGLVGEDGETHHGVFDVGFLRHAPGMTLLAPASCLELEQMLRWAVNEFDGPVAVRYPRGGDGCYTDCAFDPHKCLTIHRPGNDGAILTYGTMINNALEAAECLAEKGLQIRVIRLTRLTDISKDELRAALDGIHHLLITEEIMDQAAIAPEIAGMLPSVRCEAANLGKDYVTHGAVKHLYKLYALDGRSLVDRMKEVFQHED